MKKIIIIILLLVAIFMTLWFKKVNKKGSLVLANGITVGTAADFPPFSYRDSSNNIVGFDIDVVKEVAKRLNNSIEIQDMSFDSLLPQLKSGLIQVVSAGMSSTPEREKSVRFTKPYLQGNPLMVISLKNSSINNFEDLKNKSVVVNTGYISDIYMSNIPNIILKRVSSISDALLILKNNQADALVTSFQSIKPFLDQIESNKNNYNTFAIEETDENISMAVTPIYPELLKQIQQALDSMKSDGTLEAIKQKWNLI